MSSYKCGDNCFALNRRVLERAAPRRAIEIVGAVGAAVVLEIVFAVSTPAAVPHQSAATPTIILSITAGGTGSVVTAVGSGFPAGEIVALYIDSPNPYIGSTPPGPRADQQGTFQDTFKWPASNYDHTHRIDPTKPGTHQVCGDTEAVPSGPQAVAAKACAQFTVEAAPTSSPTAGGPSPDRGASLPELGLGLAVLLVATAGFLLWLRRMR